MVQVQELIEKGRLNEALEHISNYNILRSIEANLMKSRINYLKGNYSLAYGLASDALKQAMDEGKKIDELRALLEIAYSLVAQHQYDECLDKLELVDTELKNLPASPEKYQAMKEVEANYYTLSGLRYRYLGELELALEAYQTSSEILAKLGKKFDFAVSLCNIGTIYQLKGELDEALVYHLQAREIFIYFDNQMMLAYTYHDLANIYWEKNDFDQARTNYDLALNIRIHLSHHQNTAKTLLDLIQLHIEYDYSDLSRYYHDMLREIHTNHDHPMIDVYYNLAEASILQTSSRLINRAEAQRRLEELQHVTLPYELAVMIKLKLCQLFLFDLKVSKNEEIINRVDDTIHDLLRLAKKQYSTSLRVETLLLQSKLALIRLDLETAQSLLFQAEVYANQKNLHNLAYKVSSEHDMIVDKIYKWEKLQKRNASLIERLEEVNFEQNIHDLSSKRSHLELKRELEEPLFLLVLNQHAITLYSRKFDTSVYINEELIGGYLIASDKGIASALNNQGSIERIKYGEFQLIFIHHHHLTFCYGFQGKSYFAIKRLKDFIDYIKLSRAWVLLRSDLPKPKEIEIQLSPKVIEYFTSDGIYSKQIDNS